MSDTACETSGCPTPRGVALGPVGHACPAYATVARVEVICGPYDVRGSTWATDPRSVAGVVNDTPEMKGFAAPFESTATLRQANHGLHSDGFVTHTSHSDLRPM